jgi:hypothetical protein
MLTQYRAQFTFKQHTRNTAYTNGFPYNKKTLDVVSFHFVIHKNVFNSIKLENVILEVVKSSYSRAEWTERETEHPTLHRASPGHEIA